MSIDQGECLLIDIPWWTDGKDGQRTTSKRAIIPWSSWSSMWQWIMKAPV